MENRSRRFSFALFWLGLGVVLFAVGAKLALINRYGTDQPYADQWVAEGMYFLRGPLYYQVDLNQITALHGEHRPALTRLWFRLLVWANSGQWDCFVELVANLLIHGCFVAAIWRWIVRLPAQSGFWLAGLAMAVLFALPGCYENFLWGFQSCFLLMLLLGFVHVAWTMQVSRLGVRWWLAQSAGFFGLFSIASGAMSAATLVVVAGFELLRGRRNAWAWATVATNALFFGFALWLLPAGEAQTGSVIARLLEALVRLGYLLSWPFPGMWWALLLQVPLAWLLIAAARRKDGEPRLTGDWLVAGLGLWGIGGFFAIAYGRGVMPGTIGARYFDGLVLGLFVNALALIRIHSRLIGWRRLALAVAGFAWVIAAGCGLWRYNSPDHLSPLFGYQRGLATEQREIVRDFLVSDNPARLQEFADRTHRFPHIEYTLVFLRDSNVAPLLPPSLTPDGHAGPLSRLAVQLAAGSWYALGAGAVLLFGAGIVLGRRAQTEKSPA